MSRTQRLVVQNGFHHQITQQQQGNHVSKVTIVTAISYVCGLLAVFVLVNEEMPEPYMDEVFHVQQARSYCVGNFSHVSSTLMSTISPQSLLAFSGIQRSLLRPDFT